MANNKTHYQAKKRYITAHKEKLDKKLFANASTLGENACANLIEHCLKDLEDNPAASVVLAALFCGRSFKQILDEFHDAIFCEKNNSNPILRVSPNFSSKKWTVKSDDLDDSYNQDISVQLPKFLLNGLIRASNLLNTSDIDRYLTCLKFGSRYFTEAKVCNYIDTQRSRFQISKTELAVIKGININKCTNLYYGQLDEKVIQTKLNAHINACVGKVEETRFLCEPTEAENKVFGSFYTPSQNQVDELFDFLLKSIRDAVQSDYSGLKLLNYVTTYTAFYLACCTLCRPQLLSSVCLKDICLKTYHLRIDDKDESARIVAMSERCGALLSEYVDFLDRNMSIYSAQSYVLAEKLTYALNAETNLFWLYDEKGDVSPFSSAAALDMLADFEPQLSNLKDNFPRHFSASILTAEGINRDVISRIMGHKKESNYANRYSSLDIFELSEIARHIDVSALAKHFVNLKELT